MSDILFIEVDAVAKTGRPPIASEGPWSQLSRTGRWSMMRSEGLDLLKMDEATKAQIRASGKVFLPPDAFDDFFGKDQEAPDDTSLDVVRLQERRDPVA